MSNIAKRTAFAARAQLPDGSIVATDQVTSRGFVLESWDAYDARRRVERAARTSPAAQATPMQSKTSALIAYVSAIEALPEAASRPAAAAELWSKHNAETMPVDRAASFLRGLPPEENAPVAPTAQSAVDPKKLAKFQRLAELRVLGLTVKAERGDLDSRKEASKLSWALRVRSETGCAFGEAFASVGLDARSTIETIMKMGI